MTGLPTPGPCKSFLSAIQKLAWSWVAGDTCLDHFVRFANHAVEMPEGRTGGSNPRSLPQEHQGLMRCALNGTQYTADALHHANQVESSACCFCGQPDSLRHRHWECPHFDDLRQQLPQLQHVDITENNATAFHGWVHSPSNLLPFRQELLQTPDTTCMFHPFPSFASSRGDQVR